MRAVRARDVGLAVRSNVVARERRSVMMSERRVVKDGVEGGKGYQLFGILGRSGKDGLENLGSGCR